MTLPKIKNVKSENVPLANGYSDLDTKLIVQKKMPLKS